MLAFQPNYKSNFINKTVGLTCSNTQVKFEHFKLDNFK